MATDKSQNLRPEDYQTVRKIIQISTQRAKFGDPIDNLESDRIYALCDDGTLWGCTNLYWDDELSSGPKTENWRLISSVPQVVNPQIYNK